MKLILPIVAAAILTPAVTALPGQGFTERVSLTHIGTEPNFRSNFPVTSIDGNVIAFESSASDLVPGDTNFSRDIFVRDRIAGTTTRVSVSSGGTQGNSHSYNPSMSADGRYIVFHSKASNFVNGDLAGGTLDAFVHDRTNGTTTLLSAGPLGVLGNASSYNVVITPDGMYAAFYSSASNLIPNDTNAWGDVFVRTLATGAMRRVSVSSNGTEGNGHSRDPAISADGQIVAFDSVASNLTPSDTNGKYDIFVHVIATGQTTRISESTSGTQGNSYSISASISNDGRYVAFTSRATVFVPNDTNSSDDVFLRDRMTGVTSLISISSAGVHGTSASSKSSISADGTRIVFQSWSTFAGDPPGVDIFVHDTTSATTVLASVDSAGTPGNSHSIDPGISPDGRFVVFQSGSTNLIAGDTNGFEDIFLHDTLGTATATARNAGANPASYTTNAPVLGALWTPSVDLTTTGHAFAQVIGATSSINFPLAGAQVLLIGGPILVQLPVKPGPVASWSVLVPSDTSLAGLGVFTQAVHVFGVAPFALSNAQDLCLGY